MKKLLAFLILTQLAACQRYKLIPATYSIGSTKVETVFRIDTRTGKTYAYICKDTPLNAAWVAVPQPRED